MVEVFKLGPATRGGSPAALEAKGPVAAVAWGLAASGKVGLAAAVDWVPAAFGPNLVKGRPQEAAVEAAVEKAAVTTAPTQQIARTLRPPFLRKSWA